MFAHNHYFEFFLQSIKKRCVAKAFCTLLCNQSVAIFVVLQCNGIVMAYIVIRLMNQEILRVFCLQGGAVV